MFKKNLVFAAACIGMLLFGIVMISLGTINLFLTNKFGLNEITVGSLAALLPFGILAGSIVFGPIVDRYSYKNVLTINALLIGLSLEAIAFAESFFIIQIAFFIIGFGGGVINGATNALVADISSEGKGANLSLLGVFYGIGALGMPAVTSALSRFYSYETIISAIGIFVLLPLIYFFVIKFPNPKQPQGFPIKKGLSLLKEVPLLLLGFILFFESGLEGTVNNWTTTYLQSALNIAAENTLISLTILMIALTLARLLLGGILKAVASYKVMFVCLSLILIGAILFMNAASLIAALIAMIFFGAGFAAGFPVVLSYVGELYSEMSGTAFSIALAIALIGNTLMNYSVGALSQSYGIEIFPLFLYDKRCNYVLTLRGND